MKNQCQIRAGFAVLIAILATSRLSVAAADPDKDPRYPGLVAKAQQLALQHKTIAAIDLSEKVISAFKAYYGKERRKIYCANTSAEGLGNLLEAAVKKAKCHGALTELGRTLILLRVIACRICTDSPKRRRRLLRPSLFPPRIRIISVRWARSFRSRRIGPRPRKNFNQPKITHH